MVGGRLVPGSSVGIFISVPEKDKRPNQTHLVLPKTLVTRVEGGATPAATSGDKESGDQEKQVPEGSVLVTFALSAPNAEKVIFAAEFGTLWLSLEPADANPGGTTVVTERNVYK